MPLSDPTKCLGRRLVALLVDTFVNGVVFTGIAALSGLTGSTAKTSSLAVYFLVVVVYFVAIYGVYQGITGATPGKLVASIRTVNKYGAPPGPARSIARTILLALDSMAGLGFVVAYLSRGHQRLGDMAARTWVVPVSRMGEAPVPDGLTVELDQFITPNAVAPLSRHETRGRTNTEPESDMVDLAPLPSPPPPGVEPQPQWDESRGCYIQWDRAGSRWMSYDDGSQRWTAVEPDGLR